MKVYGASAADVYDVVHAVSRFRYDGNLVVKSCEDRGNGRGPRAIFTLQVIDSHRGRPGAIGVPGRTGNGPRGMKRRSNAACWHAYWDVIEELLRRHPTARVTSGFRLRDVAVQYTADTVKETARATAHLNVGSWDEPITMPQCCECDHSRYTDEPPEVDATLSQPAYRPGRIPTVPSWMPGAGARSTYEYVYGGEREETDYAAPNGGHAEPWSHLSGHGVNHRQHSKTYPWDVIPAARPWVKPGSSTVGDTLALIDEVTSGDTQA
jgi:hypothetical protein